jgi:hypothetical protein
MTDTENLKVKTISTRVSIANTLNNDTKIWSLVILPYVEKTKMWGLLLWILAWTVSGLIIIGSYKVSVNAEQKLFIIIFTFFWLYYEWKMINVYIWKKWGKEKVWIKDDTLYIEEDVLNKKRIKKFKTRDINSVEMVEFDEKSFLDFISNSFWNKGKARVKVNVLGKDYYFAYQITDTEAREIVKELRKELVKYK